MIAETGAPAVNERQEQPRESAPPRGRHKHPPLVVKFWGDIACFTRPENKVERVSYPVMTPSAATGALSAIFWKPEMDWRIESIAVLNPIAYSSMRHNEIDSRQTPRAARRMLDGGRGFDITEHRVQRNTLSLRDVAYIVRAHIELRPGITDRDVARYRDQFRRRVRAGRCFSQPYLGQRECVAWFSLPDPDDHPLDLNQDLGLMLHSIEYDTDGHGTGRPRFFDARLEHGVLHVPRLTD